MDWDTDLMTNLMGEKRYKRKKKEEKVTVLAFILTHGLKNEYLFK